MEAKFTTLFNCSGRHHPENSENERLRWWPFVLTQNIKNRILFKNCFATFQNLHRQLGLMKTVPLLTRLKGFSQMCG